MEVHAYSWSEAIAVGDGTLLVLHYPKYTYQNANPLPRYKDLRRATCERCRQAALLLMGIRWVGRSAVLNTNRHDAIQLVARAMWETRFDMAWVQLHELPAKKVAVQ